MLKPMVVWTTPTKNGCGTLIGMREKKKALASVTKFDFTDSITKNSLSIQEFRTWFPGTFPGSKHELHEDWTLQKWTPAIYTCLEVKPADYSLPNGFGEIVFTKRHVSIIFREVDLTEALEARGEGNQKIEKQESETSKPNETAASHSRSSTNSSIKAKAQKEL
ncbi:glycogen debranching enzyme GlgX [Sesbania bispinosa]|nr:glycogen debranching enzyme GlgX [Sesbania bispinosa]